MAQDGTLIAWSTLDGVGRIQLDDGGEVIRVGQTALGLQRAAVGARCRVVTTAPHPLGGLRATEVRILEAPPPVVEPLAVVELRLLKQRQTGDLRDYERWLAKMPPTSDLTAWLHERIRRSSEFGGPKVEIERLAESHEVLRGVRPAKALYGIDVAAIDAAEKRAMVRTIEEQLLAWKGKPIRPVDQVRLHRVGRRLGLAALEMAEPPRLRGEPFGTTEGLDADWQRRVALWADAAAGKRPLALAKLGVEDARVAWAPADLEALRDAALEYETGEDAMFPRELAAMLAAAPGVSVDDAWLVAPPQEWTWEDGLRIGAGSYFQGSLTVASGKGSLLRRKVLDRDDDGGVLHRFANLAAFFDAILG
jgi:hypothetical protein